MEEMESPDTLSRTDGRTLERKTTFISRATLSGPEANSEPDKETSTASSLEKTSTLSEDMQGLGLLDPKKSVLLRFECMSAAELKVILFALYTLLFMGTLALIGLILWKNLVLFLTMTIAAHNSNPWLENGKPVPLRPDPLIVDAPLWYHAPKLLIWSAFQGTLIFEAIIGHDMSTGCVTKTMKSVCEPPRHTKIVTIIWGALLVAYFVTYGYYKGRARIRLGKLPYNRFWTGNLLDSWQTRQGRWIMNFMVSSVLTSWYFSWNYCSGYFTTWLGVFPLEIVVTGAMVANVLFMFPVPASKDTPGVQTLLQGFCWSEATREADLAQRNELLALHVRDAEKQPLFCLETAIKLLAFSWVVYSDEPAASKSTNLQEAKQSKIKQSKPAASNSTGVCRCERKNGKQKMDFHKKESQSLEQGPKDQVDIERGSTASTSTAELTSGELLTLAMQFYDLQHTHIIHEENPDTKAWRADHVPVRGHWWLGRRPMVHKGFWRSWSAHGVRDRVLDFLRKLLADSKLAPADWHVYLTGHSLGGALATLAAYDIQAAFFSIRDLQVYTYGAPRTGNYAFARDYEELVPETWHVVHDADLIPRVGKFFRLYKRPVARVIVDRKGSIVVRPSPLELHLRPVRRSVKAHYLKSYQAALAGVLRAQFSPLKAFVGGRRGACTLADDPHVFSYLCSAGLDLIALSETDGRSGDTTDSESVSEASEESPSRMPACLQALMDQVFGTSLKADRAQGPGDDHDLVTGSFKDSAHDGNR
ncbi:probable lipase at C-terminar half [Coccomyxa sp. Obi]|nr:probable lipase at C-terminar half [Coccomyxa sp. Obi]